MIVDHEKGEIQVKIVYYGPAMSGKTTSIKQLFKYFGEVNKLKSIENTVGRTLFFDFGILKFKGTNWNLKFLVYSATGQDFYASTRPATLRGVDGIIFIIDSQRICLENNIFSWKELLNLFGEEIYNIPLVFSLNKYDLENIKKLANDDVKEIVEHEKFEKIFINKTVAATGKGVLEAFKMLINLIFPKQNIIAK
ncbi:MAG: ADP-ribosylation factor-like protein [Promethearchaeia archaeon]